ncbi:ABC transporter ATP-binding protein [Salimicrobium jeotgali]|uniref:ABC transporter ATP-binding protein n=1 Tax=Salimicrobium jeotgali TaxID=1230341 RepID=K2H4R9_9BACI|nr:ATP-binding cassette domain-containing protein [Salimicrobium jeotgali]AKG03414.1 ABC transporter ATP-binding protein [Salimicrobium jeotgali]EKE30870.1 ABC transporter ATP-binding protein [Salimicrobium jeotgali]MBM7697666.1 ABC-2 type transport system ATP-binding protein [Salimicrobium jeotgali]
MQQTLLSVEKLGKSYKNKQIVKDISFSVKRGMVTAILGPNGAGKSTTIRSMMGIMQPDEGSVKYQDYPKHGVPHEKVGYLPEERGLYKNVKIMDVILYFADLKDYPKKKAKSRALDYLKKFGLEGKDKVSVEELSKGMAQKAQFIASIIHEPELLILDEPFSGLDPVSQDVFKQEIRQLADNGTAILISSHQMNLIEEIADDLLLIHKGKTVIKGSMEEVKEQYSNYKCTIIGENEASLFTSLPSVQNVERDGSKTVLYLDKDVHIPTWISHIPKESSIQEMTIDRISLHEIFVGIATEKNLMKSGGGVNHA